MTGDLNVEEAMIVVATQTGFYGNTVRYEGERFAISGRAAFASTWMVDPHAEDANAARIAKIEAEYASRNARPGRGGISDDQLLAEIAMSGGRAEALRLENVQMKGKLDELQKQLDQYLAGAAGAEGAIREGARGARRGRSAAEGAAAGAGGLDAGGLDAGETETSGDESFLGEESFLGDDAEGDDGAGETQGAGAVRITRRRGN